MPYWLFQGNLKYYRVLEAIKDLEEMPWPVTRYIKDVAVGDGVLVWVAGAEAGIYAIAEITEPPQIFAELPDAQYWIDPLRAQGKQQAKIRFVRKLLGQPLRKPELKEDQILKNLLVMRAPNSTNFKVTDEEWKRVHHLKA